MASKKSSAEYYTLPEGGELRVAGCVADQYQVLAGQVVTLLEVDYQLRARAAGSNEKLDGEITQITNGQLVELLSTAMRRLSAQNGNVSRKIQSNGGHARKGCQAVPGIYCHQEQQRLEKVECPPRCSGNR